MNHFARCQFNLVPLHDLRLRKLIAPQPKLIAFVEIDLNLSFIKSADRNIRKDRINQGLICCTLATFKDL
jgi:hypothetical protein